MTFAKIRLGFGAAMTATLMAGAALAQDGITGLAVVGRPHAGGIGFQPAATELARDQQWLDGMVLYIITAIVIFVVLLLAWSIIRFNRRANPTPARFTHNAPLEITWTLVPILILVAIGSFSLPTLFKQQEIPAADIVVKVTGYQWYWGYSYPDEGISFDALMIEKGDMAEYGYDEADYLLAADNAMVVPVGKTVVLQITGADVIHSWAMPAFAIKQDAVPGRIAQAWFKADLEGIYFGQCSELCGQAHSYMPITVKVVSQEVYDTWLAGQKSASATPVAPLRVALN
ncbi:MAG: cytochrome c oxidase subunit II [Alphaproteobacteria bacterium HGW-Alphaproteobacteria-4]|nr:MAG: cytochrome c oxidase subunit II [Alphaproteobacteria bacterium HGW-Alphaproteobacteria-4]